MSKFVDDYHKAQEAARRARNLDYHTLWHLARVLDIMKYQDATPIVRAWFKACDVAQARRRVAEDRLAAFTSTIWYWKSHANTGHDAELEQIGHDETAHLRAMGA